ncbi:hypothetical protein YpsIP31758_2232 [Yersinia pseudotuberculosis IP 31758]|uniref:Uncharacterized protein n=1 Tax=Yersinia pseudotuberculosis serotype O:1b (strain IP 31758) TaxID=349747 RepID=A0A0U1QWL5_YERP3|nr:hypothetical protein YpsIP31758_2232 [Yersinia pseudotuberculosis IP 31758]
MALLAHYQWYSVNAICNAIILHKDIKQSRHADLMTSQSSLVFIISRQ